ncbi:MAG: hypothetical protein IR160_02035 [Salinibacterium sp.]|nr:hypothetical protein [Salinibacterium sp.]MBF0671347.1 hypothetical protein [Salinibacterium sp.]
MTDANGKITPPSLWVSKWSREEAFWRDVASRGLAGLIVVAIGAAFAFGVGLLPISEYKNELIAFGLVLAWLVIWTPLSRKTIRWAYSKARWLGIIVPLVSILVLLSGLVFAVSVRFV